MKMMCFVNVSNLEKQYPYYLYCAAYDYDQETVLRPEGCNWYQLNICLTGEAVLEINGKKTSVKEGESIIVFPGVPYTYTPVSKNLTVSWIAFDGFQVKSLFAALNITKSGVYRFNNYIEIHNAIKETLNIQKLDVTKKGIEGSKYVYNFALTLLGCGLVDRSKDISIDKLQPSIEFMHNHIGESIAIEDIASSIGVTPQHYCSLFKSIMHQRPFEFLNSIRINYARELLSTRTDLTIKEISILAGYPNQNYFIQLFKKSEWLTPAKFRELYRKKNGSEQ